MREGCGRRHFDYAYGHAKNIHESLAQIKKKKTFALFYKQYEIDPNHTTWAYSDFDLIS